MTVFENCNLLRNNFARWSIRAIPALVLSVDAIPALVLSVDLNGMLSTRASVLAVFEARRMAYTFWPSYV